LGSGVLFPSDNLLLGGSEPSARESLAAGADLVCFSGDKLLGGPQAGIVVGRADLVEQLRRHPLQRAMRADKLTLAALEGTLGLYLDAPEKIPVLRMLRDERVRERAEHLASLVGGTVEETVPRAGGGALPLAERPSPARWQSWPTWEFPRRSWTGPGQWRTWREKSERIRTRSIVCSARWRATRSLSRKSRESSATPPDPKRCWSPAGARSPTFL